MEKKKGVSGGESQIANQQTDNSNYVGQRYAPISPKRADETVDVCQWLSQQQQQQNKTTSNNSLLVGDVPGGNGGLTAIQLQA